MEVGAITPFKPMQFFCTPLVESSFSLGWHSNLDLLCVSILYFVDHCFVHATIEAERQHQYQCIKNMVLTPEKDYSSHM